MTKQILQNFQLFFSLKNFILRYLNAKNHWVSIELKFIIADESNSVHKHIYTQSTISLNFILGLFMLCLQSFSYYMLLFSILMAMLTFFILLFEQGLMLCQVHWKKKLCKSFWIWNIKEWHVLHWKGLFPFPWLNEKSQF